MKFVLYIISFSFLLIHSFNTKAQGQNNNWCFGGNYGLNFNTSPPTFFSTNMSVFEGSAAVSDENGQLLFYSSGAYIWDRNGNLMPNGQGLLGNGPSQPSAPYPLNTGSSCGGVCIVQSPSNPNQYYNIVTDANEDMSFKAYYSIIDMSLNGGMGDVVSSQKNIIITNDVDEGAKAVVGADCNSYWVLFKRQSGPNVLSYKIDASGFSTTPVVSPATISAVMGHMVFNRNETMSAIPSFDSVHIFNFDKTTGLLSAAYSMQSNALASVSVAFSPDASKLYVGGYSALNQFDLSLYPNTAAIQNSQTPIINNNTNVVFMRLAPDDKIYGGSIFSTSLHCIAAPNALGTACQFTPNAITLSGPMVGFLELGNRVPVVHLNNNIAVVERDTICNGMPVTLTPSQISPSYNWNTGASTSTISVNAAGKYWAKGIKDCTLYIDTFQVYALNLSAVLGPDTAICKDASILLQPIAGNATYTWQDGSAQPTFEAGAGGVYSVNISRGSCSGTDSIRIGSIDPSLFIVEPDTVVCNGQSITLHAIAYPESTFTWNTGTDTDTTFTLEPGVYSVWANNVCGTFYDSVKIDAMSCSCHAFMPNAFSPNGDGLNDVIQAYMNCPGMIHFIMKIYNRYGQQVFQTSDVSKGWDGIMNGKPADIGTYFYYLQYKSNAGEAISKKGDFILMR